MANDNIIDALNASEEEIYDMLPCKHDPSGRCNGDHADEGGDFTSASDDD